MFVNFSRQFQNHRPDLAEHIRTFSEKPSVALSEARRFRSEVRRDWEKVNIRKVCLMLFSAECRRQFLKTYISQMDETLYLKFTQHADLRAELLATGNAELLEVYIYLLVAIIIFLLKWHAAKDSDKDSFWGVGPDYRGRNELGKALERLRTKLRGYWWSSACTVIDWSLSLSELSFHIGFQHVRTRSFYITVLIFWLMWLWSGPRGRRGV